MFPIREILFLETAQEINCMGNPLRETISGNRTKAKEGQNDQHVKRKAGTVKA
jgi:hypothetical protein